MSQAVDISPTQLWARLEPKITYLPPAEQGRVRTALEFAFAAHQGQLRMSGEPYIVHPVAVAEILAELGLDAETLMAGLLHDTVEDTEVKPEDIEERFGTAVRRIVEGETKVSKLYKLAHQVAEERPSLEEQRAEDLR
ncbi:MAG: bifunctional (p)ppGpp synthetase/guanosine-3',5'-bis(diphosphate) 3'-pyrophosphohydrolase, partial [Meiothermus silvanus]|nr:bifunctional (p)ppGpp synthetase/guanosine-3',5'-bis(diphosphate) 3'-pyrophosphohydrolase [Allomeiothermus silvanus]